jgi:glucosylglycerol-phosphate synthase
VKHSIILIYHREPYDEAAENARNSIKPNGIIPILKSFFKTRSNGLWVCGKVFHSSDKHRFGNKKSDLANSYHLKYVSLSRREVNEFYHITSKEAFWPLLHSFPEKVNNNAINWELFKEINQRFAEAAVEEASDRAIFWVHDYNLWLVPYYIRLIKPNATIAFYHHTPFPKSAIFNLSPYRKEILESLLSCDLCSFNIPEYVENFVSTVKDNFDVYISRREKVNNRFSTKGPLGKKYITRELEHKGRIVHLDAIPEGPDLILIEKQLSSERVISNRSLIKQIKKDQKLIFSASRVDYTKGIIEMLKCYNRLLERRKDILGKIVLCNVSIIPQEGMICYNDTINEIEYLINLINLKFSDENWTPILHHNYSFSFTEMISWYAEADIMWVTPLRDGMNLVCKEYVASRKGQDGILILSEFAGAAVELDGALLTNPCNADSMDETIDKALSMPLPEEQARMQEMYRIVTSSDVVQWGNQINVFEELKID